MKSNKKILKFIFIATLLFTIIKIPTPIKASTAPTLTINSVVGTAGQNVTINVSLSADSQACGGNFNVVYDDAKLEVVSAVAGDLLTSMSPMINTKYAANKIRFTWAGVSPITTGGNLCIITFKVKNNTSTGNSVLSLENAKLYDSNSNLITNQMVNGGVNIGGSTPPVITAGRVSCNIGQNVTVSITLSEDSQVCGGNFNIVYDNTKLEVVSAVAGNLITSRSPMINTNYAVNKIRTTWAGVTPVTEEGNLCTITFKVKSSASTGNSAVTIESAKLYDENSNLIASQTVNGSVSITSEKTIFTLSELLGNEAAFNDILRKFTLDELKIVTPKAYILGVKIIHSDSLSVSQFEVNTDREVYQVKLQIGTRTQVLEYKGGGLYKSAMYNLSKGSEVIISAYDKNGNILDSNVQRLRMMNYAADVPDRTEFTLEELVMDLDAFNQILSLYTLEQIKLISPLNYFAEVDEPIQIKYSQIFTGVTVYVKNGVDKVEFETTAGGQIKTVAMINKGNGKFEGSLAGVDVDAEMKIKVYKDDELVDDAVRRVNRN